MSEEGKPQQTAVDWAFEEGKRYKTSTRFVLVSLARCIEQGNNCPSHKDLSEMTGVSKDTVRRALGELEKDGLIAITRNGGDKVRGGHKDCYDLPKCMHHASMQDKYMHDTGSTMPTGSKVSAGKNDTPKHEQPEISTVEYARAAGEKELLKELKEFVVIQQQTDSLKPIDTRANVDIPAQTELDLLQTIASKSPEVLAQIATVLSKTNPPAVTHSTTPNPGSGAPLPPEIAKAYQVRFGYSVTDLEKTALLNLLKRGEAFVLTQIAEAKLVDAAGKRIHNPMRYIEKTLALEATKPPAPAAYSPRFVARAHQHDGDKAQERDYPEDMQFEPPASARAHPAAKGVPAW